MRPVAQRKWVSTKFLGYALKSAKFLHERKEPSAELPTHLTEIGKEKYWMRSIISKSHRNRITEKNQTAKKYSQALESLSFESSGRRKK